MRILVALTLLAMGGLCHGAVGAERASTSSKYVLGHPNTWPRHAMPNPPASISTSKPIACAGRRDTLPWSETNAGAGMTPTCITKSITPVDNGTGAGNTTSSAMGRWLPRRLVKGEIV